MSLAVQTADPGIADLGAQWYFNWSYVPHEGVGVAYVPLVGGYPGDEPVADEHLVEVEAQIRRHPQAYGDGTLFLIGNEIGYRHQKDGRSPREYAVDFHRCRTLLKSINPTFQISVGPAILSTEKSITSAIVDATDGLDYLQQVIDAYRDLYHEMIPADYFAATNHVMKADETGLREFQRRITQLRALLATAGLQDRSVILTEFGVPLRGSKPAEIEAFMTNAVRFVATATDPTIGYPADGRLVQRWAWFTARPIGPVDKLRSLGMGAFFLRLAQTSLYTADGSLTHLGHVYRSMMGGHESTSATPGGGR